MKKIKNNIISKLLSGVMLSMLFFSTGITVYANNCEDTDAYFSFDGQSGDAVSYSDARYKSDYSSGYIKGEYADGNNTFSAALIASDVYGNEHYTDFELIWYNVEPGEYYYMTNYVKENGYNYAQIKGESDIDYSYHVHFKWSPDSI